MRRSYLPHPAYVAAGFLASLPIRNFRQRCEANWMARHGVPREEIRRRLNLSYQARIVWGYWYVCIYFPCGLGALVTGWGFLLTGVFERLGLRERTCALPSETTCDPAPILFPAFGALVGAVMVFGTWWSLAQINGIISAGIPGYGDRRWPRVPSWREMGEGMPAQPGDTMIRVGSGCLALAISVAFHGLALASVVSVLVELVVGLP